MVAYAARIAVAALFAGAASAQCGGGDGIACEAFKTTRCGSSVYDISFVLDKSGSMNFALNNDLKAMRCEAPRDDTDAGKCIREDIMRYVLRQVHLSVFKTLQQPCLEYQESILYTDTRISCADRGFTKPRFQNVWWAKIGSITEKSGQTFDGPLGSRNEWNNQFTNWFYNTNDNGVTYTRNPPKWELDTTTGDWKMKQTAVKKFFEEKFLTGDRYPESKGGTYLNGGLDYLRKKILEPLYGGLTDTQKKGTFPIFVMTDGELSAADGDEKAKQASKDIRTLLNEKGKAVFTGLGLSFQDDKVLRTKQTELYRLMDYNFCDKNGVCNFFDTKTTTENLIKNIFGTIEQECQECYTFDTNPPITKCVPIGAPEPDAPGTAPKPKPPVNVPEINENTPIGVYQDVLINSIDVKYGDTIRTIPENTALCYFKYEVEGLPVGNPFVTYDTDDGFQCACCANIAPPCLCDFRETDPIGTSEETIAGVPGVAVNVYDTNDLFIESLSRADTNTFPETDSAPPPAGPGGNGPPLEEDDGPGGIDNEGSGPNGPVDDTPDDTPGTPDSNGPTTNKPDTVNDKGTAASLLPSLAGLVLASLPIVLA